MGTLQKTGAELIAAERRRQIEKEGYTAEHDDCHVKGEIEQAAKYYAATDLQRRGDSIRSAPVWPWHHSFLKLGPSRVRELIKAGALFRAEKERVERARLKGVGGIQVFNTSPEKLQWQIDEVARTIDYLLSASQDWFNSAKDQSEW